MPIPPAAIVYDAIARGDFPTWDVKVQIMPVDEAASYRWNPFDLTKTWSQKDYPLIPVGHFTLNRNPENFFAQIEQAAFAPSNLVRGIGFSPDKMLLARVFAYADAHRYRVGANSDQLPVNRPVCPVNSYSHDGPMTYQFQGPEQPVYSPNGYGRPAGFQDSGTSSDVDTNLGPAGNLGLWADTHGSEFVRDAYVKHPDDDDFMQAGILVREVLDDAARERLAGNISRAMNGVTPEVEQRVYEYWTNVDPWLGNRVRRAIHQRLSPFAAAPLLSEIVVVTELAKCGKPQAMKILLGCVGEFGFFYVIVQVGGVFFIAHGVKIGEEKFVFLVGGSLLRGLSKNADQALFCRSIHASNLCMVAP